MEGRGRELAVSMDEDRGRIIGILECTLRKLAEAEAAEARRQLAQNNFL